MFANASLIILEKRDHHGYRGEGDVRHAVGLFDVDDGFVHLQEGTHCAAVTFCKVIKLIKIH